ncbi:hypothetical protein Q8A73_017352 [Channa argus]|nr:hypothetical protein Q8A73_017352 [Channa argus]
MNVTGIYLGMADIHHEGNVSVNGTMGIENNSALNTAINVFILAVLFTSMISIGCTMEAYKIKNYLFNPKGAVIAMLSQFGIMPLTAFGLAKILKLDPIKALTVLICGCSPGGNLSNIFSLAINGDMNLSIVMTTCSNIAAMVMMPLLLYIYSQGFPGLERAVPYLGIIVTLILTLVPCAIGIAINHYKPHYSAVVKKVGFSILIICSIIVFTLSAISVKDGKGEGRWGAMSGVGEPDRRSLNPVRERGDRTASRRRKTNGDRGIKCRGDEELKGIVWTQQGGRRFWEQGDTESRLVKLYRLIFRSLVHSSTMAVTETIWRHVV